MLPMRSVVLFILLMCGLNHAVSKSIQPPKSSASIPENICSSKICNETASEILKNMDSTAEPCNDFFKFACGGFMKSTDIPDGLKYISIMDQKKKIFMSQLKFSLNEIIKEDEPRPLKMVKAYFKSCMDEFGIEKNSVKSLLQVMKSVGGWPVIEGEKWNETNFDWIKCVIELQKMGYFIDNMPQVYVGKNSEDGYPWAIYMKRESSNLLFRPDADNETIAILREDMVNIAVALGANRTFAEKEVRDLFSFVLKLHDLNKNADPKDMFKKFSEIVQLSESNDEFFEKKYIEKLILPFSKIENDDDVIVSISIDYLQKLMANTPKRMQANYIIWSAISQSVESLNKDIREKYEKLLKDGGFESSMRKYSSRTEECIEVTSESMGVSLQALYIRNHFDRKLKNDTIIISENIRKRVLRNLGEIITLSPRVKNIFRRKIEKVKTYIAYEGDFFNDTELNKLDKNLNISSSDDYLHNNINLMKYMMGKSFTKLRQPIDQSDTAIYPLYYLKNKREWKHFDLQTYRLYSIEWNTWYMQQFNSAVFPSIYFQGNMNKIGNPEYIKYGAIGFALGHEYYHALDNECRNMDENSEKIYWQYSSKQIFRQQDECFITQYENFSLGDTKLNGKLYLQENIADHGGIKAAYLAYSDWASKKNKSELLLPNLPYTPKQMFWISVVNNYCSKQKDPNSYDPEDKHTPDAVRFIGAFSNIPDFAKDFNCAVGSRMNPLVKCSA